MKEINWKNIQEYYDNNHTWKDIKNEFNISYNKLSNASKNGFFKTRSKTEANKLANIKSPRKLSKETKEKISKSRIKYLKEDQAILKNILIKFLKVN